MAMMKEAAMAREEIIDQVQKLVLCGRATLDALEALTKLCLTAEEPHAACTRDDVDASSVSIRSPEPSGELSHSTASPLSSQTRDAELCDEKEQVETASLEQVRSLLAEKSRKGFRAEVKALLTAHGVNRLSEISDPAELGKLMAEAEKISG